MEGCETSTTVFLPPSCTQNIPVNTIVMTGPAESRWEDYDEFKSLLGPEMNDETQEKFHGMMELAAIGEDLEELS